MGLYNMHGLYGTYVRSVDAKGRVIIPARLINFISQQENTALFMTRGIDRNVSCYIHAEWIRFTEAIYNLEHSDREIYIKQCIGHFLQVNYDKRGRIVIPPDLLEYSDIDKKSQVKIVGFGDKMELWNPESYYQMTRENPSDVENYFRLYGLD